MSKLFINKSNITPSFNKFIKSIIPYKNIIIECDHFKTVKQSKVHRRVKTLNDKTVWEDRNLCCLN